MNQNHKTGCGVCVAVEREWVNVLSFYGVDETECVTYPYGSYFEIERYGRRMIFYLCGARKTNASAATQYMIDHFPIQKIIVIGTCAGIDSRLDVLDIVIPYRAVQVDTTVRELDRLVREAFTVDFSVPPCEAPVKTGVLGSGDKAVVMWQDFMILKENNITVADTESAAVAYVCRLNGIKCAVIRGVSDIPENIPPEEAADPNCRQIQSYLKNIPLVIQKILTDYLEDVVRWEGSAVMGSVPRSSDKETDQQQDEQTRAGSEAVE